MKKQAFFVFFALGMGFFVSSSSATELTPKFLMDLMGKPKADTMAALIDENLLCSPFPDGVVICKSSRLSVIFSHEMTKSIDWKTKGVSADLSPAQFGDLTGCKPWKRTNSIELQGCPKLNADVSIVANENGPVTSIQLLR